MKLLDFHQVILDWFRDAPFDELGFVELMIDERSPIGDLEDPERWRSGMDAAEGWYALATELAPIELAELELVYRPFPYRELQSYFNLMDSGLPADGRLMDVFWDTQESDAIPAIVAAEEGYVTMRPSDKAFVWHEIRLSVDDLRQLLDLLEG